jgi:hypothetical protein
VLNLLCIHTIFQIRLKFPHSASETLCDLSLHGFYVLICNLQKPLTLTHQISQPSVFLQLPLPSFFTPCLPDLADLLILHVSPPPGSPPNSLNSCLSAFSSALQQQPQSHWTQYFSPYMCCFTCPSVLLD